MATVCSWRAESAGGHACACMAYLTRCAVRNEDLSIPVELAYCAGSISTRPKKPGTFIDTLRLDFLRVLIHGHDKQGTLCSNKYRQNVHGSWCIRARSLSANKQVRAAQRATIADPSLRTPGTVPCQLAKQDEQLCEQLDRRACRTSLRRW